MRSAKAPLFAVLILVVAGVSLFNHRIPVLIQSALFFGVLFLEIALIAAGWWYCIRNWKAEGVAKWRKRMALVGVAANTIAFAIPLGSLVFMMFYPFFGRITHLPMIDGDKMVLGCLIFAVGGVIAGMLAPPRSRFATSLGSLIIALIVLAIPMGVL